MHSVVKSCFEDYLFLLFHFDCHMDLGESIRVLPFRLNKDFT